MANEIQRDSGQDMRRDFLPAVPEHEFDPESVKLKMRYFAGAAVPSSVALTLMGAGLGGVGLGLVAGGAVAYFAEDIHGAIAPGLHVAAHVLAMLSGGDNGVGRTTGRLLNKNWWLGEETPLQYADQPPDTEIMSEGTEQALTEAEGLFTRPLANDTGGVRRLTIDEIVENTNPNSYQVWIGRSLTKPGNPAVLINIYKQHFRFMGASQRGKTSMCAAFLEIVTRTHDPQHVRLVLLDKEDQTSNLFAHLPHVLRIRVGGEVVKMHARDEESVLKYLMCMVEITRQRYKMSKEEVLAQPIILIYLEEFLSLKNYFKAKMNTARGKEAKEKATADYTSLVLSIEEISQEGLKARVQLLLCAQVEYADDDFREALVNVQCGMAFCVRPTAAASAGFRNTQLVKRNAEENKVGQAVVETPDCNDLVLSPEYDVEKRVMAQQKASSQPVPDRFPAGSQPVPESEDNHSNGKQFQQGGKHPELDPAKMLALREMTRKQAGQNEIIAQLFPGMRNVDAIQEYRKYLSALIEG